MAHDAAAHGHHHGGEDHVPHVSPVSTYLKTFGVLMVLTIITVAVSYVDLGVTVNLIIALIIATIKAGIVAALFMHLLHDNKFHTIILLSTVVFVLVFISFTIFDTGARGRAEAIEKARPAKVTAPFEGVARDETAK